MDFATQISIMLTDKFIEVANDSRYKNEVFNGMYNVISNDTNINLNLMTYAITEYANKINPSSLAQFCLKEVRKWEALKLNDGDDVREFYKYSNLQASKKIECKNSVQDEQEREWLINNITIPCREDKPFWSLEELRKVYKAQETWKRVKLELKL